MILGFSQDSGTDVDITHGRGCWLTGMYCNRAFIQLAGFTFGKATSYFDFVSSAAVAYNAGATSSPDTGDAGHVVAAYTAQFGNGISGTISFEQEPCSRHHSISVPRLLRRHRLEQTSAAARRWPASPAPGHRRQPARRSGLGCCPDRDRCA